MSQDNQLFALNEADGATEWTASGALEASGRVRRRGARRARRARSSPASRRASSTPIATKMAARCGRTRCRAPASPPRSPAWPISMLTPVIDRAASMRIGQGGRMVALELATGQRIWEQNHRRHLDAVDRGRMDVRGDRRRQADVPCAFQRQGALADPAARVTVTRKTRRGRSAGWGRCLPAVVWC